MLCVRSPREEPADQGQAWTAGGRASGAQTPTPDMQRFQQLGAADPLAAIVNDSAGQEEAAVTPEGVHSSSGSLCSVRSHRKSFRRKLADFFRWKRRKTLNEEDDVGGTFERYGSCPRRISAPVLCHISTATCPTPVLQALPVVFFESPPGGPPNSTSGPVLPYIGYRSQLVLPEGLSNRPRALVRPQPKSVTTIPYQHRVQAPQLKPHPVGYFVGSCNDVGDCNRVSMVGSLPEEDMGPANRDSNCSNLWSPCDENFEAQLSSSAYVFSLKRRRKVPRTVPRTESTHSDPSAEHRRSGAPIFPLPPPPSTPPPSDLPPQPSPFFSDKAVSVSSSELSPLDSPCSSDDDEEMATPPSSPSSVFRRDPEEGKGKKSDTVGEVANIVEEVNRMTEELLSALQVARIDDDS